MGPVEPPGPGAVWGRGGGGGRPHSTVTSSLSTPPIPLLHSSPHRRSLLLASLPLTSNCSRNWVLFASLYPLSPADLIQTHGFKHHLYLTILNLHLPPNLSQTPDAYPCLPDISLWMSDRSKIECLISHPPQPVPPTVYPDSAHASPILLLTQVRNLTGSSSTPLSLSTTTHHTANPSKQLHLPDIPESHHFSPPSQPCPGLAPPSPLPQTTRLPWSLDSKPIFLLILFLLAFPTSFPAPTPLGLHPVP